MRGVAVSFAHDVRTCRHVVGKVLTRHQLSGKRVLDGVAVQALEHEALEESVCCIVSFFSTALPGTLRKTRHW